VAVTFVWFPDPRVTYDGLTLLHDTPDDPLQLIQNESELPPVFRTVKLSVNGPSLASRLVDVEPSGVTATDPNCALVGTGQSAKILTRVIALSSIRAGHIMPP
jgi:hypothetical protein